MEQKALICEWSDCGGLERQFIEFIQWMERTSSKNEMTPQGHRGKPIQQLFFLWARSAPSKKKIIAEMEGMAGGNLMEEGRP